MVGILAPLRRYPGLLARLENEAEKFWDPMDRYANPEEWDVLPRPMFPVVNVIELDEAFEVTVELPGINPEDVKVEFQEGILWISGEKKAEKTENGPKFHRIERAHGEFHRKIELPGKFSEAKIVAEFEQGVLKVVVPKCEELKPKRIKVKVH
jgi:HSP20 family protein